MTKPIYFEDFADVPARRTSGRTITETDVVVHAGHTGDFYPHHVDAHWAANSAFGERIAHGTLVLSVGAGLAAGEINPVSFSYGYDRVRFVAPSTSGTRSTWTSRSPTAATTRNVLNEVLWTSAAAW